MKYLALVIFVAMALTSAVLRDARLREADESAQKHEQLMRQKHEQLLRALDRIEERTGRILDANDRLIDIGNRILNDLDAREEQP